MKLKSLKLENFRQHESSYLEFNEGITIINGVNGSGKSTILEAISWAIYGTDAARGNKDSIKFNRAKPRTRVCVELVFEIDKDIYRVIRHLDKAEVYIGENEAPVVTSQQEVTRYLTEKTGMTRHEFFNTYFTGQKELNFLKNQGATERKKFISRVLNYNKIRNAQEAARIDKNGLEKEIAVFKQGLQDVKNLEQEKKDIKEKLNKVREELDNKQKQFNEISDSLMKIEPEWEKIKTQKASFEKFSWEKKSLVEKNEYLEKNIKNLSEQIIVLEQKNKKLDESDKIEAEYKSLDKKIKEQETLQEKESLRQNFSLQIQALEKQTREKQQYLDEIVASGKEKKKKIDQLPVLNEQINTIEKKIQKIESDLTSQKKEKEVLIKQKNSEIEKIKNQLSIIEEKGEDGACPTCERPLKNEFEKVTGDFKEQIITLEKEINSIKDEIVKIPKTTPEMESFKKEKAQKEKDYNDFTQVKGDYEAQKRRYLIVKSEIDNNIKEHEEVKKELSKLPEGFDIEVLKNLREQIVPLRAKYEKILALKAELANFDRIKKDFEESQKLKLEVETCLKSVEDDLNKLCYSEENFTEVEKQYNQAKDNFYKIREEVIKIEGEEKSISNEFKHIEKIEESNREKMLMIAQKQEEVDLLYELERFYSQLWEKLNDSSRPEISDLAGKFLSDLTDNRYSMLELNEKYDICLHDDGEIKPVISGGEEDIVNLCIRLAVSQIIAQRSGKALSLLVLDEIFGSLDENRRSNVIQLLRSLTDHFEQVILITHIDDIKHDIDNIINIEFDPETGSSRVSSQAFGINDINEKVEVLQSLPEMSY